MANIYLFNINNRNTKTMREICSKLKKKSPEQYHSGVFILNIEHPSHLSLLFLLFVDLERVNVCWDTVYSVFFPYMGTYYPSVILCSRAFLALFPIRTTWWINEKQNTLRLQGDIKVRYERLNKYERLIPPRRQNCASFDFQINVDTFLGLCKEKLEGV